MDPAPRWDAELPDGWRPIRPRYRSPISGTPPPPGARLWVKKYKRAVRRERKWRRRLARYEARVTELVCGEPDRGALAKARHKVRFARAAVFDFACFARDYGRLAYPANHCQGRVVVPLPPVRSRRGNA